ncbi:hypothetical protein ACJIZ3_008160 [Penstemon smallii]|uniref:Uncharacterized protein n=1 Tax=Penstemon smallii TaxID=265156 RepID=A0ABD3T8Z6_9LAMI
MKRCMVHSQMEPGGCGHGSFLFRATPPSSSEAIDVMKSIISRKNMSHEPNTIQPKYIIVLNIYD